MFFWPENSSSSSSSPQNLEFSKLFEIVSKFVPKFLAGKSDAGQGRARESQREREDRSKLNALRLANRQSLSDEARYGASNTHPECGDLQVAEFVLALVVRKGHRE